MATITLKFSDTDVANGNWAFDIEATRSEIDDGQATAAYFTGFYLSSVINTPDFMEDFIAYGRAAISGLTQMNPNMPMATMPGVSVITLEDKDLQTGRYVAILEMDGPEMETALPTTAQLMGAYVRALVADQRFAHRVWDFAEAYVTKNTDTIIPNLALRPGVNDAATVNGPAPSGGASIAA